MVKTELEMLDIRHFSARQLRPILDHEARVWQKRLRWDYAGATNLLLQYFDSRMLPGYVALDQGRICGYTFCVYEGCKAVVGDAFSIDNSVMGALPTTRKLLRQLLHLLLHSPDIRRIESQLLLYSTGDIAKPFDASLFETYRRLFMQLDLKTFQIAHLSASEAGVPDSLELHPWNASDYHPAAALIQSCYVGHVDARINDQYRSIEGSLRFLHNIIHFPGCGTFDPKSSWVLRERKTGGLAGMILCSRVRYDTAHVTQLCISHAYRGRKLGTVLLRHALRKLFRTGYEAVTLTVTETNRPAVNLYLDLLFQCVHIFDAHVLSLA